MVEPELQRTPEAPRIPPALRNYQDYRHFLRDWFAHKKTLRTGFSYRRLSQVLGLKSPNFFHLVLSGQRNLSPELAKSLAEYLCLSVRERNYFLALVRKETARGEASLAEAEKARRVALRKLITSPMSRMQEEVFTRWYHMLVRELVFVKGFEPSGEYISAKLNRVVSVKEAEESLALLLRTGFLVPGDNGKLKAAEPVLDSGNTVFSRETMQKHHGETLKVWGEHLKELSPAEQELGLLHIPIRSERIPELRARIRRFQDEVIGWLESERDADRVVQLGTYLVPFSGEN